MGRSILAVIAGYVAIVIVVMAGLAGLFVAMGADWACKPAIYQVSTRWALASAVIGLVAAVIGGFLCAVIAKRATPPRVLAAFVFVLGLALAIPVLTAGDVVPAPRVSGTQGFEAMRDAVQPKWVALLNPVIGAVGVLIGAGLKKKSS